MFQYSNNKHNWQHTLPWVECWAKSVCSSCSSKLFCHSLVNEEISLCTEPLMFINTSKPFTKLILQSQLLAIYIYSISCCIKGLCACSAEHETLISKKLSLSFSRHNEEPLWNHKNIMQKNIQTCINAQLCTEFPFYKGKIFNFF